MKLSQIEYLVTATEALKRALDAAPALSRLAVEDCLKATTDRAVFRARLGAETVIVKLSFGADATERVRAQADELRRHAARMSRGRYRTPGLLAAAPDHGLIVMEYAPGQRLDKAMRDLDRPARDALCAQAGTWLHRLIGDQRRPGTLPAGYWLRRTRQVADGAATDDRGAIGDLLGWMETEAARIDQTPLTQIRGHGDFCPVNLIVGEDAIWGIDLESDQWFALARDIARYLVVSRLVNGIPISRWHGVDGDDAAALLAVPGLIDATEADRLLPFFLAGEMARRLAEPGSDTARGGLHAAIADFLTVS